ncbi:MAG TPA: hypothetical protein VGF86_15085 [Candidatus Tumulicola sp.]
MYVSDIGNEDVQIFSYPAGKLVGTLTGFNEPNGLCSDSNGNVFVTDAYNNRIVEYAHGETQPLAVLSDTGATPIGCAVGPTTGDLAVTNYQHLAYGTIAIYAHAQGTPTVYTGLWITFFCTYDGSGNLFISGFDAKGPVVIGELAKGASQVAIIPIGTQAGWAGGISWDGHHLALGDQYASKFNPSQPNNVIYQLTIKDDLASVNKTMPLNGAEDVVQFWLRGKTVVAPDSSNENVGFFKYPKGGNPTKALQGFYEPVGATISK